MLKLLVAVGLVALAWYAYRRFRPRVGNLPANADIQSVSSIDSEWDLQRKPAFGGARATSGPRTETIEVPRSGQSGKLSFLDSSGAPCSREQAAMDAFRQRGFRTLRGEVRFWQAMFGLAFWEEIFDGTGTPNGFQDIPSDLFSGPDFYQARRTRIDSKARRIAKSDLEAFVRGQLDRRAKQWTRIVYGPPRGDFSYREVLESGDASEFLRVISPLAFAKIIHRIACDPSANRAGLPDYMVWKDGEVTFVEVKGPREKIRESQKAWHDWMQDARIPLLIVRVKGVT